MGGKIMTKRIEFHVVKTIKSVNRNGYRIFNPNGVCPSCGGDGECQYALGSSTFFIKCRDCRGIGTRLIEKKGVIQKWAQG